MNDDIINYEDGCCQCHTVISRSWYKMEMASYEAGKELTVSGVVCEACFDALSEPIPEVARKIFKDSSKIDLEFEDVS